MFQIQSEQFKGPFEVLLQMIEDKKLSITELSLSAITGDFLEYVRSLQNKDYAEIGDFLVVGARLIFIKSKELLPKIIDDDIEEVGNLELQLKIYREIKQISKALNEVFNRHPMFGRGYFEGNAPSFLPGPNVTAEALVKSIGHFFLFHSVLPQTTVERRVVKIEEKVADILRRLESGAGFHFKELSKEKDRIEIIVLFLALLELMKTGVIVPTQEGNFDEIMISKE